MTAAPRAEQLNVAPENPIQGDAFWAANKPGGALHLLVWDLRRIGMRGWSSPCGWVHYEEAPRRDIEPAANFLCGRCIQHQDREEQKRKMLETPCAGCNRVACLTCSTATEDRMLAWIQRHYQQGSGSAAGRFHYLTQVRSGPEQGARIADAVALDTSVSNGFELTGYEVKVSRQNWVQELQDPRKWQAVGSYCDRWWLAIPDLDIVRGGEVPPQWGILLVFPTICHVVRPAPQLDPKPIDRPFVASLLRAAARTGDAR